MINFDSLPNTKPVQTIPAGTYTAVIATAEMKKANEDAANKEEAKLLKEKLSKVTLEFKVKTGEGDRVFGSISIKQIKDELAKKGYKIEKSAIELTSNISSLGFHNVNINLYPEITAQIKVHVIK